MAIPSARNYVVLDQNVINVPEVVARLHDDYRRDGRRILLSHLARFEMTKGTADGFRKDITELARLPGAVSIALPVMAVAHAERERCRMVPDVEDGTSTTHFRRLLVDFPAVEALSTEQLDAMITRDRESAKEQATVVDWDELFIPTARNLLEETPIARRGEILAGLDRSPQDRGPLRQAMLQTFGSRKALHQILRQLRGIDSRVSTALSSFPSMLALDVMASLTVAFTVGVRGEIDSNRRKKKDPFLNWAIDAENAVLACRGFGFETRDTRALALMRDLRFFARTLWGWNVNTPDR